MRNSKPILLVEDDNVDVMTVKRALRDLKVTNQLVPAGDGEEAIGYLKGRGNAKPCVILLDLNMPKMNGSEFLQTVKADKELKEIPVVVLTTSNSEQDIVKSFELGAAGYMVKSVDYNKFMETI
ncbi:MAG: response regulator, partial [Phycisphaerales bacterium]